MNENPNLNNLNNIPAMDSFPGVATQPTEPVAPAPTVQPEVAPVAPVPTVQPEVAPVSVDPTQAEVQPVPTVDTNPYGEIPVAQNNTINTTIDQQNLQNIPNVEQSTEDFVNKTQSINKKETTKGNDNISMVFVAIIFIAILAAVFFLFPIIFSKS